MILPIYIIGANILRQKGQNIPLQKTPELTELITNMFETMQIADGVGLAAQQIGKNLNLFAIDLTGLSDEDPTLKNFKKIFINTKIIKYSENIVKMNEGCLSIPGLREDILRPQEVQIQYYDENLTLHNENLTGFPARVLQHEYDHTCGIMFPDRVPKVKKVLLKNKLKAIAAGKFKAEYRTILGNKNNRNQTLLKNI